MDGASMAKMIETLGSIGAGYGVILCRKTATTPSSRPAT
jgi:hypothetical protein